MKKNLLFIAAFGFLFMVSCAGEPKETPEQTEAIEQSTEKLEQVTDSTKTQIDTAQSEIDGLLKDI